MKYIYHTHCTAHTQKTKFMQTFNYQLKLYISILANTPHGSQARALHGCTHTFTDTGYIAQTVSIIKR